MTQQLIIPESDIYISNNKKYFKVRVKGIKGHHDMILRDIPTQLEEINVYTLKKLAKLCEIKGFSTLRKVELISIVKTLIVFPE
jgi:hypothetical protein